MRVAAERYAEYYRDILKRIAGGYPSPASLAEIALEWTLHHSGCSYNKGSFGECDMDCSQSDAEAK